MRFWPDQLHHRTASPHARFRLIPGLENTTTSLPAGQFSSADVIALYADHGTHEQFHSEFKTDRDFTRLPSGKFDTNYLVCQLAAVAMNILRLIGQRGLLGPDAPVRHPAKRRRLKTVNKLPRPKGRGIRTTNSGGLRVTWCTRCLGSSHIFRSCAHPRAYPLCWRNIRRSKTRHPKAYSSLVGIA